MDLYDVASGYESEEEAYSRIEAEVLFVGISSDWLFPPYEVRATAERARAAGADAGYVEIDSLSGHDAFLKDWYELEVAIGTFVKPRAES
jgi:homoserine O-acetyltransferase